MKNIDATAKDKRTDGRNSKGKISLLTKAKVAYSSSFFAHDGLFPKAEIVRF